MKPSNTLILQGNLTRDLEVRQNASGYTYGTTAVAVNERFRNDNGEWENKSTMFIDVFIGGEKAKYYQDSYKKGRKVTLMGELSVKPYKNKAGEDRLSVSIKVDGAVLVDSQRQNNGQYNNANQQYSPQEDFANQSYNPEEFQPVDDGGDIPF